jgi:hypothetical protein
VDLFEDVGIAGLVDLEGFVAVWANDVVHGSIMKFKKNESGRLVHVRI